MNWWLNSFKNCENTRIEIYADVFFLKYWPRNALHALNQGQFWSYILSLLLCVFSTKTGQPCSLWHFFSTKKKQTIDYIHRLYSMLNSLRIFMGDIPFFSFPVPLFFSCPPSYIRCFIDFTKIFQLFFFKPPFFFIYLSLEWLNFNGWWAFHFRIFSPRPSLSTNLYIVKVLIKPPAWYI